jgi:hypothetical protein
MNQRRGPALPIKPLPVNGLFAALPQIEVVVPQIERNSAAHDQPPPQTPMALARQTRAPLTTVRLGRLSKPGQ